MAPIAVKGHHPKSLLGGWDLLYDVCEGCNLINIWSKYLRVAAEETGFSLLVLLNSYHLSSGVLEMRFRLWMSQL